MHSTETLLANLDEVIEQSSSVDDLETRLSRMARPSNLVYLGLEDDDNFDTDIIGSDNSNRTFTINGSGYGRINDQEIIIIHYPVDKFSDVQKCIIYILRI